MGCGSPSCQPKESVKNGPRGQTVSLHADVSRKAEFAKLYVQCMQALSAYWTPHLHHTDLAVLRFILERTVRWGKYREAIPYRHFTHGVRSSDGDEVQCGLGISRRSIIYAIHRLEHNRLVAITRSHSSYVGYVTNIFEINFNMLLGRDMSLLRTPKRLRQRITPCANSAPPLVQSLHPPSANPAPHNIHKGEGTETGSDRKPKPTADAFGSVEEALAAARQRGALRRASKAATVNTTMTQGSVLACWNEVMLRYYPRVPVIHLTGKEFGIFKKAVRLNLPSVDLPHFFDWTISGWVQMRGSKLAWMNRKVELLPLAPTLTVVAKYLRVFARLYSEAQMQEELAQQRPAASRLEETEVALREAEARLAKEQAERHKLAAANEKLRRIRPQAPSSLKSISKKDTEHARRMYEDDGEIGSWQD